MSLLHFRLTLVVALLCAIAPAATRAEENEEGGFLWFGGKDRKGDEQSTVVSNNLNQNVYMLDTLADQMVFRFGLAFRIRKEDPLAETLHKYMKRHALLTDALVKASRGKDPAIFKKAAENVRNSATLLAKLAERTEVGKGVNRLITNSIPLAEFVCANVHKFKPPTLLPEKLFGKPKPDYQASVGRSNHYLGITPAVIRQK